MNKIRDDGKARGCEVKEQIENIISKWSDDAEFYMTQQQKSELAERLDKAIGIDEDKLTEIVGQAWCTKENENKEMDSVLAYTIIESVTQSRPLKCDIEDVAQGRQDRLTRRKA